MTFFNASATAVLAFEAVCVSAKGRHATVEILRNLSFSIAPGETYGLVGESGCGKSTVALAAVRYLWSGAHLSSGHIRLLGVDLGSLDARALRAVRAKQVSMVYQDAGRALNPSMTIGQQVMEACAVIPPASTDSTRSLREQALALLRQVELINPEQLMGRYPHQLSGGMQQRVVIAMALAPQPRLLILDEPTTGLDATVAADVLALIDTLRQKRSMAILFISHDLRTVAALCHRVGVLYAGELVEEGSAQDLFARPRHPYTRALLNCLPHGRRKPVNVPASSASGAHDDNHALSAERSPGLVTIPGALPVPRLAGKTNIACSFADRCEFCAPVCLSDPPPLYCIAAQTDDGADAGNDVGINSDRLSRCHFHEQLAPFSVAHVIRSGIAPDAMSTSPQTVRPLLRVRNLSKTFGTGSNRMRALDDISFDLWPGETLGVVGESGSGKTTLSKVLLGLETPDTPKSLDLLDRSDASEKARLESAPILLNDIALASRVNKRSRPQIRAIQTIFQNPDAAMNRSRTAGQLISRAMQALQPVSIWRARGRSAHRTARQQLAQSVRLPEHFLDKKIGRLSGGLKQRVAIARAFAGAPQLVICDEPTSALDVSVQAAILTLLDTLQQQNHTAYLFISHDLDVVTYLADRIAVLYRGKLMEIGTTQQITEGPNHPYTAALLRAAAGLHFKGEAQPETNLTVDVGSVGDVGDAGCVYRHRCAYKIDDLCDRVTPSFDKLPSDPSGIPTEHALACHLPVNLLPRTPQEMPDQ